MRPAVLVALVTIACFLPGRSALGATAEEAGVVAAINAVRVNHGLRPLELHPDLERKADEWANHLAAIDTLVHSRPKDGITVASAALAENLASAQSVQQAEQLLLSSPTHYANIVDPRMTHVGVGIVPDGEDIYLVEEFMQLQITSSATGPGPAPTLTTVPASAPVSAGTTAPLGTAPPARTPTPAARPTGPRPAPAGVQSPGKPSTTVSSASPAPAPPVAEAPAPVQPAVVVPATPNMVEAVPPAAAAPDAPALPTVRASASRSGHAGKPIVAGAWLLGALAPVGISRILSRRRRKDEGRADG